MVSIRKSDFAIRTAYEMGYRINAEGRLVSHKGIIRKVYARSDGYYDTNIRINGKLFHLPIHRFCAYQKYGEIIFEADCVRHLDGNPKNNTPDNIEIGTNSDNMMDIPKEIRIRKARRATSMQSCFRNDESVKRIKEYHEEVKSYKKTMLKFDISSKGTLFYILNNR